MQSERFCNVMAASYVTKDDLRMTATRNARAKNFQHCYQRLIAAAGPYKQVLRVVEQRSQIINHEHRMTGDGLIAVIEKVVKVKDKLRRDELQAALDAFIDSQVLVPGKWRPIPEEELSRQTRKSALMRKLQEELDDCKETI